MAHSSTLTPVKGFEHQIEFARHNYDNQQALIRQLDVKAGVFITLLVFLATGVLPGARDVSAKLHWSGKGALTSWIYVATGLVLVVGFLATVLSASNELFAREGQNIEVYQAALCLLATFSATGTPKGITPKRKI